MQLKTEWPTQNYDVWVMKWKIISKAKYFRSINILCSRTCSSALVYNKSPKLSGN